MAERWRSAACEDTVWAEWDDVHVVHHRPSGKTHLLNLPSAVLVRTILQAPKPIEAATLELAEWQSIDVTPAYAEHLERTLLHLEHLGLVERA
jgi:PqqD family protein of HPr-rel-A system